MIELIEKGNYTLLETKANVKILYLGAERHYAWINAIEIGELLVASHKEHHVDCILSKGPYRLYSVKEEDDYTDLQHLELCVGEEQWQGYLLLTGLPRGKDKLRSRIIPSKQIITKDE